MKVESILLSGASGFLGKAIVKSLSGRFQLATLGRSEQNIYRVDLAKTAPSINQGFDLIIHAAGKAHVVPQTKEEAEDFFSVNVRGCANLLHAIEQTGKLPKAFIFISTVAVYGRAEGEMITEEHPLQGDSPYAKSKIEAEQMLATWCRERNVVLTILRLPLLIGSNAAGNLKDMIKMISRGLYLGIGSGNAKKSMVLASDVAGFIPDVALKGGIYNLTDGMNPSMIELENAIALRMGKRKIKRVPDSLIRIAARVGDVLGPRAPFNSSRYGKLTATLTFSDAKARLVTGWKPNSVIDNLPEFY